MPSPTRPALPTPRVSRRRSAPSPALWLPLVAALLGVAALAQAAPDADAGPGVEPAPSVTAAPARDVPPTHAGLPHRMLVGIEDAVHRIEPWLERYGYGAVFALIGVEGFGIPAPGQTILEAGAAAAAGARHHPDLTRRELRIGWLLGVAFIAASLGSAIGYGIGRIGGRGLLARLRVPAAQIARIEAQFARHGGWLIVFGRFFDGPRQLNGLAAGVLEMHWLRFMLLNLAGAALWVCFWGLGVYYLDLHLDAVVAVLRHLNPWIAVLTAGALAAALLVLVRRRRRAVGP